MDVNPPSSTHVVSFLLLIAAVHFLRRYILRVNALSYPSPPTLPFIGNLLDLRSTQPVLKHPGRTFREWGKKYGSNAIALHIPGAPMLVLNTNKDVQEVLVKRSGNYSDRPRAVMLNEMMGGDWLLPFMKYNDQFRTTRKLFHQLTTTDHITRPNQIKAIKRLLSRLLDNSKGEGYDKHFRLMTGDFILSAAYGITPTSAEEPYIQRSNNLVILVSETNQRDQYIADVFPWLKHLPSWFPGVSFKRTAFESRKDFEDARELPFQHVKEEMAKGVAKPSLAAHFLENINSSRFSEEERARKSKELSAALGNVYLGAADTTNAAIWSYVLIIALHPEVQKKGQAAVDTVLDGRLPTLKDFGTIPYVDAIVDEVFRFSPITPLGVPHVSREEDIYEGRVILKGTMVFGNIWALLRDEEIYGTDTDNFIPERFITASGNINPQMEYHLYDTAFGWGRRICPGKEVARETLWLTVASLLVTFSITDPVDKFGTSISPDGIDCQYTQRPVSMPPYFTCSIQSRGIQAENLIREELED
ncbi:cytochrome P450 [Cyathus striatus]|nr:cytochrome P450 [Cyathus striatus]